jgi:DNA-binding MarR family transcriptional regulator
MKQTDLRGLLDAVGLTHPCDLDLLLFFHRHPTALMASDSIAAFAGYDLAQVSRSLDTLVRIGVLRRTLNPTHLGRLYYFTTDGAGDALPSLLGTASTPDGRRQLVRLLGMRDFRKKPNQTSSPPNEPPQETKEDANNYANDHA